MVARGGRPPRAGLPSAPRAHSRHTRTHSHPATHVPRPHRPAAAARAGRYASGALGGEAPHVFHLAHRVLTAMLSTVHDQAVLISGESGAGKSENTKLMLQFIADVSSRSSGAKKGGGDSATLEQQILQASDRETRADKSTERPNPRARG